MTARVTHLMGWTVVRVDDGADLDAVAEEVLTDAQVVLELRSDPGVERDAALVQWQSTAGSAAARVVVASDEVLRERLRAAGLRDVFESLDAAVGDEAPAEHVEPSTSHITPFAGDAVVVTAMDMLGRDGRS
jgi:hypothetical protein